MTAPSDGSTRHADRSGLPAPVVVALAAATALCAAIAGYSVAQGQITPVTGFLVGGAVGILAVLGLPSFSIRLVCRLVLMISATVMVRFGVFGGVAVGGGQALLIWLVSAVAVMVLTDRVGRTVHAPLDRQAAEWGRSSFVSVARATLAVSAVVVAVAVLAAPLLLPYVGKDTEAGRGASLDPLAGGAGPLRASDSVDMTTRPALTDEVVLTIESDRATFWRGETYDRWDGRTWTRSDTDFQTLRGPGLVRLAEDDLGARGDDEVVQRVTVETEFAEVVFAAPSPVSLELDRPVRQRADGTLVAVPMGRGTVYEVTSRREPLSPERLRAVDGGATPETVAAQYAQPPATTERVRDLASEITAGAATRYDAIVAMQDWMGARIEYSLDAPLAPTGVDVVDHFLFESEQGWCEQIASSLVVLARQNGIPARLVTGYVPADRDPVTGVFTVRERDAHAWAEVWFPEVGWVPFDPTAEVGLAGSDLPQPTVAGWVLDHLAVIALGVAAVVLLAGPLRRFAVRARRDRRQRPHTWAGIADARLDALGDGLGRPRRPDETARAYGAALDEVLGDDRLVWVGGLIDDVTFAPDAGAGPPPAEQEAVTRVLEELARSDPGGDRPRAAVTAGAPSADR